MIKHCPTAWGLAGLAVRQPIFMVKLPGQADDLFPFKLELSCSLFCPLSLARVYMYSKLVWHFSCEANVKGCT